LRWGLKHGRYQKPVKGCWCGIPIYIVVSWHYYPRKLFL
jgi:hypothetical protein